MGSIFWQLNDCWPVASWSSIDYYGRWKALQYYARRFYAPILVSPHIEDGSLKVYIVSDKTEAQPATLRVRLMDFDGKVLLEDTHAVDVVALSSKVYLDWPLKKLADAGAADTSRVFVVADLAGRRHPALAQSRLSRPDKRSPSQAGRAQSRNHRRKRQLQGPHNLARPRPRRLSLFRRSRRKAL